MSALLIDERPLTLLPSLVKKVGLERAVILQQIHFAVNQPRSGKVLEDGHKYVWNTYEEWSRDHFPFWTANAIQKHFAKLEELGYLISAKPDAHSGKHTKYYRIDYSTLLGVIDNAPEAYSDNAAEAVSNTPQRRNLYKGTETSKTETSTERVAADAAPPVPKFQPSKPQAENLPLAPVTKSPHQECVDYLIERVGRPHPFERQMASLKRMLAAGALPVEIKAALDQAIIDSEMGQKFTPLFTAIENGVVARLTLSQAGATFQVPSDMKFPEPFSFGGGHA